MATMTNAPARKDCRQHVRKAREVGPKLSCPSCKHEFSVVLPDGRMGAADEGQERIYRRLRECRICHTRFTTVERVEGTA